MEALTFVLCYYWGAGIRAFPKVNFVILFLLMTFSKERRQYALFLLIVHLLYKALIVRSRCDLTQVACAFFVFYALEMYQWF